MFVRKVMVLAATTPYKYRMKVVMAPMSLWVVMVVGQLLMCMDAMKLSTYKRLSICCVI